jgi:glycosyltransferase involved in cell wall biosynthesis
LFFEFRELTSSYNGGCWIQLIKENCTVETVIDKPPSIETPDRPMHFVFSQPQAPGQPVRISVVIPLFNEEESIGHLYDELSPVMNALNLSYEVVVVDDGSSDQSFARLKEIHTLDSRWRIIRFRRNFGQTAALTAGFEAAQGEITVTMDADLQNDPRDIAKLLAKIDEGYDIVSGWRVNRKEPFFSRRLPSITANWLIARTTGVRLHDYGCTLKAYRSDVSKNVRLYGELHRFIPAIASGIGITFAEVPVNDRRRRFGRSKYGIMRTFKVMLDLLTVIFFLSFSTRPLHVFGAVGMLSFLGGGLLSAYLAYARLFLGEPLSNRPALLLAVMLIVLGVQITSTGLVAEFVMRNYHEPQGRKTYVVREVLDGRVVEKVEG